MPLSTDPILEARRNWDRHGWPAADAMAAATSITRAHQLLLAEIDRTLRPFDLNFSRFEALALLHSSRSGALPMGKIGERLQVHAASVTNTIDRLERDGLVARTAHPTDGRTRLAAITNRGREVVDDAARALGAVDFGVAGLDALGHRAVESALAPVRAAAGDIPDDAPAPPSGSTAG